MMQSSLLFFLCFLCYGSSHKNSSALHISISLPPATNNEKCISINGKKIFLSVIGTGKTTVIFVSALGEDHSNWKEVQEDVSKLATTVSYDRSGLGISDYNARVKKDAASMAEELHQIVVEEKIKTPFIIVSHSLGCTIARVYANKYPKELSGAVYVDPPPNQDQLKVEAGDSVWNEREKAIKRYTPPMNKAQQEEYDLQNVSFRQADKAKKQPSIPTILLTATLIYPDFPASALELKIKKESHAKWLTQMKGAEQLFVKESRHYIQNDAPQIVTNAIKKILAAQQ
jgi:pimeloyl-ACP methyl ester carboxylesterase